MVGAAPERLVAVFVLFVWCVVAGSAPAPAGAQFLVFDRGSDAYGKYAVAAGGRAKIGRGATVEGSVRSNRDVALKHASTVAGDVLAAGMVTSHGVVTGDITEGAPVLALPRIPSREDARAASTRILSGPVTLAGERIDDVLFVAGAVRVEGPLRGMGTLIATGPIELRMVDGDGGSGQAEDDGDGFETGKGEESFGLDARLSVLSYADVSLGPLTVLRGIVRARGRIMVSEEAQFEGSLFADGDVEVGPAARLALAALGDFVPPALTIFAPPEPVVLGVPDLALTILYADLAPGIDASSVALLVDDADLTHRCSVDDAAASCSVPVAASGTLRIAARVRDLDGNASTSSLLLPVVIDAEPPSIAIESPLDGALVASASTLVLGSVEDDGLVTAVTVDGALVATGAGGFAALVALAPGGNLVRVGARDSVGRSSERMIGVTLDDEPPRVTVRAPAAGEGVAVATHLPSIRVGGDVTDRDEIASLEIAGVPAGLDAGAFDQEVALEDGENRIVVAATDRAGNVGTAVVVVERWSVPVVAIHEPEDGALVVGDTIDVRGALNGDPEDVHSVTVNGLAAAVADGLFSIEGLPIGDGATLVNVLATSRNGLQGSAGVTVVRDRKPPSVVVVEPRAGAIVHAPTVKVTGTVNDVVVGTVNAAQVAVTVNGERAEVANRQFLLERLLLVEGENVLRVEAVDPSGNIGRQEVVVRRASSPGAFIAVASGDLQHATAGETLPRPLVAILRDAMGTPVAERTVLFDADGTDGGFEGGARRQTAVTTDVHGMAAVELTLGRRAGHQRVQATAIGFAGEAVFTTRAVPGPPAVLVVDSGDQQAGVAGGELRAPLAVVVTDDGFNRLEAVPVRFEVLAGGGRFAGGETSLEVVSDSDGRATVRLILGDEEGVGSNVVRASVDTPQSAAPVTFAASGLVAKDPADTEVSGVVLDNTDQPVPGATVSLEGTALAARTDAAGFFRLTGAPVGTLHLRVDGGTIERPGVWPSLEFLITTIAGRDNSMGRPLYVLPLRTENALAVDETTGGMLTMSDLPGFALDVAPGSVTFPAGQRSGVLTVTPVHSDRVPMPPNFGQQPRFVITLQPGGARFDPPAPVAFPNVDGLAAGQVTELYSFDHDLARFVSIGTGTVSDDGLRIESDPGTGIAKAGWHGGGDPERPATCHDCGVCTRESGGACVADDAMTPPQGAPDDCRKEVCRGGKVESDVTNQELARQIPGNCYDEVCPTPHRTVNLADAPQGLKCCGDPSVPLPGGINRGLLTGIFDSEEMCCVQDGRAIISKRAPIDLSLCPKPVPPEMPIEVDYDGCSVPDVGHLVMTLEPGGLLYSGDRNEPTPPGDGDALFSLEGGDQPLEGPCDRHDECYQTCGSDRVSCDGDFGDDLLAVCERVSGTISAPLPSNPEISIDFDRREQCEMWAVVYREAVSTGGLFAYQRGQEFHCDCECS